MHNTLPFVFKGGEKKLKIMEKLLKEADFLEIAGLVFLVVVYITIIAVLIIATIKDKDNKKISGPP